MRKEKRPGELGRTEEGRQTVSEGRQQKKAIGARLEADDDEYETTDADSEESDDEYQIKKKGFGDLILDENIKSK